MGKRATLWINDLLFDIEQLDFQLENLKLLGCKGTTGTGASFLELFDGDAVTVIKDLKVKGSSMVIKRGTKVKSIRLTENPEEVDCKIDGSSIVLKTCFLKK